MIRCRSCGHEIPDQTDDYFNPTHTEIACPTCNYIQGVPPAMEIEPSAHWRERGDNAS